MDELQSKNFSSEDVSIIALVNNIIDAAVEKNASDIHFELYEQTYRVRFRIDSVLYEYEQLSSKVYQRITARIKILANLDISERRLPQDGHIKIVSKHKLAIDIRVSTCPTIHGEKIVLRILNYKGTIKKIDQLGFLSAQLTLFTTQLLKPQGIILVTGPTGSGKSITLYSALQFLNANKINITTIEDPVEIYIPGVNQIQIHPKAGITFATGLRTILRQDPDIIMIGEIRDLETAEIAIRAAQTGHLVLATLHAINTVETITRLLSFNISASDIANPVNLIIAQRLVRLYCLACNHVGCKNCIDGYSGQTGVFEMLVITPKIQTIILNKKINRIYQLNQHELNLKQAGLNLVDDGRTNLDEINRVI
jgi:type IV pilus assembly protein PilB